MIEVKEILRFGATEAVDEIMSRQVSIEIYRIVAIAVLLQVDEVIWSMQPSIAHHLSSSIR